MRSAFFGDICGAEILQATNFDASILWIVTYWISIVLPQSWRSSWTVAGITIVRVKCTIEHGRNCSLVVESQFCGFGIIRFARNSTVFCKQSGSHCRSCTKTNPHLNPLPLAKGRGERYTRALYNDEVMTLGDMCAFCRPIAKNVAKNLSRHPRLTCRNRSSFRNYTPCYRSSGNSFRSSHSSACPPRNRLCKWRLLGSKTRS